MPEDREGLYGDWKWLAARNCWVMTIEAHIYPMEDGRFVTSYGGGYNTPGDRDLTTFEDAEAAALGISPEQAERDRKTVAALSAEIKSK